MNHLSSLLSRVAGAFRLLVLSHLTERDRMDRGKGRAVTTITIVVLTLMVLGGCGTLRGAGEDLATIGAWLQKSVPDNPTP